MELLIDRNHQKFEISKQFSCAGLYFKRPTNWGLNVERRANTGLNIKISPFSAITSHASPFPCGSEVLDLTGTLFVVAIVDGNFCLKFAASLGRNKRVQHQRLTAAALRSCASPWVTPTPTAQNVNQESPASLDTLTGGPWVDGRCGFTVALAHGSPHARAH